VSGPRVAAREPKNRPRRIASATLSDNCARHRSTSCCARGTRGHAVTMRRRDPTRRRPFCHLPSRCACRRRERLRCGDARLRPTRFAITLTPAVTRFFEDVSRRSSRRPAAPFPARVARAAPVVFGGTVVLLRVAQHRRSSIADDTPSTPDSSPAGGSSALLRRRWRRSPSGDCGSRSPRR